MQDLKVTWSMMILAAIFVAAVSAGISLYLSSQYVGHEQTGPEGIQVLSCSGTSLNIMNIGGLVINGTEYEIYDQTTNEPLGAKVMVTELTPNYVGDYDIKDTVSMETVNIKELGSGLYYLYRPGKPYVHFQC